MRKVELDRLSSLICLVVLSRIEIMSDEVKLIGLLDHYLMSNNGDHVCICIDLRTYVTYI